MYSARGILAALAILAAPLPAQDVATLRSRLARVRVIQDSLRHVGHASSAAMAREAQRGSAGPVLVAVPSHTRPGTAEEVATRVWNSARESGLFATTDLERLALVAGIAGPELDGRLVAEFSLSSDTSSRVFLRYTAENAAWNLSRALLPESWRGWLDENLQFEWNPARDNAAIIADLKKGEMSRTRGCLANNAADCAAYLAIDGAADPVHHRFTPDDIRALINRGNNLGNVRTDGAMRQCVAGNDAQCYRSWLAEGLLSPSIGAARQSVVHFIRATRGADVARRMLADPAGTWGSRVTRATGAEPAVLAGEWRDWLFSAAKHEPPDVSLSQAAVSMTVIGLLLAAAARSPRCRV